MAQTLSDAHSQELAHARAHAEKNDEPSAATAAELRKKTERVPLHLVCPAGVAHEAQAMRDGYLKYGYASFLDPKVKMTMTGCIGAAMRHLERLLGGEDAAPEHNGAHHAGHARAMLGILLECMEAGVLIDDRKPIHRERKYIGPMFDRMAQVNGERDRKPTSNGFRPDGANGGTGTR
jgi:hypothetical protein